MASGVYRDNADLLKPAPDSPTGSLLSLFNADMHHCAIVKICANINYILEVRMVAAVDIDQALEKIKNIIITTVSPTRIILFGSRARGDAKGESDYDILILKDNLQNERQLTRKVNHALLNSHVSEEVDLIASSTDRFANNINNIGFIYKHINEEGVVLYG